MTTLVTIDTRTCLMRRYEGRRLTNTVQPTDIENWPLSAAYLPVIEAFRKDPGRFRAPSRTPPEAA